MSSRRVACVTLMKFGGLLVVNQSTGFPPLQFSKPGLGICAIVLSAIKENAITKQITLRILCEVA